MPPRLPCLFAIFISLLGSIPVRSAAEPFEPFEPRTIVFIGSFSIEFWETLPEDFSGRKVMNLGKAGTTYSHFVAHAGKWAARYPADRYVIYSGDNDIAGTRFPRKTGVPPRISGSMLMRSEAFMVKAHRLHPQDALNRTSEKGAPSQLPRRLSALNPLRPRAFGGLGADGMKKQIISSCKRKLLLTV